MTASYTTLEYRRIGDLVHIQGYLSINSSTASGNIQVSLPFEVAALGQDREYAPLQVVLRNHGSSGLTNIAGVVNGGTDYFTIISIDGSGTGTWLSNSTLDSSWNMWIGGSYIAT